MADAEERVSILGLMKDEISAPAKSAGQALGGIATETYKTNDALSRLADILQKTQEAMAKQQAQSERVKKATVDHSAALDQNDQVSRRVITRSEQLGIRLVALGYALESIGGQFGKVSVEADAFRAGIQTMGSALSVFPNLFGAAIGLVIGLGAAFAKYSQAIAEINKKNDEFAKKQEEVFQRLYAAVGKQNVQDKIDANNPIKQLADQMERVKENAEAAAAKARELRQATEGGGAIAAGDELQKKISEAFEKKQQLDSNINPLTGKADDIVVQKMINDQNRLLESLITKRNALTQSIEENKKAQAEANLQVENAVKEYLTLQKAIESLHGFKGASDQLEGLLTAELKYEEQFRAGDITEQELAKQKLDIETKRLEIYEKFKEFYGIEQAASDNLLGIQQAKVTSAEREVEALKEAAAYEKDARANFEQSHNEKEAQLKEEAKLAQAVAVSIADGFSQATGALIDGLVQGNLNMAQFAAQFALNLSKMIAQALVLKAVMAGLGVIGLNSGGPHGRRWRGRWSRRRSRGWVRDRRQRSGSEHQRRHRPGHADSWRVRSEARGRRPVRRGGHERDQPRARA